MKVVVRLFLAFVFTALMTAERIDRDIFPSEVQGWVRAPGAQAYTSEDLYKYIDGASELYISYGFKKLFTRRYERTGWPEITVDLFNMGAPGNAFGIFAHSQESPDRQVGQDSEYLDGLLRFWQGSYFVSLLCSPETPESRTAVMALGKQMAQRLPSAGARPEALSLLPENGLIAPSIRYFRHPAWQNTYVFISPENPLEIGPDREAILARYDLGGERLIVLLVLYPDNAAAGRAFAAFSRLFQLPDGGGRVALGKERYLTALVENRVIAVVWHGHDPTVAGKWIEETRGRVRAAAK